MVSDKTRFSRVYSSFVCSENFFIVIIKLQNAQVSFTESLKIFKFLKKFKKSNNIKNFSKIFNLEVSSIEYYLNLVFLQILLS